MSLLPEMLSSLFGEGVSKKCGKNLFMKFKENIQRIICSSMYFDGEQTSYDLQFLEVPGHINSYIIRTTTHMQDGRAIKTDSKPMPWGAAKAQHLTMSQKYTDKGFILIDPSSKDESLYLTAEEIESIENLERIKNAMPEKEIDLGLVEDDGYLQDSIENDDWIGIPGYPGDGAALTYQAGKLMLNTITTEKELPSTHSYVADAKKIFMPFRMAGFIMDDIFYAYDYLDLSSIEEDSDIPNYAERISELVNTITLAETTTIKTATFCVGTERKRSVITEIGSGKKYSHIRFINLNSMYGDDKGLRKYPPQKTH